MTRALLVCPANPPDFWSFREISNRYRAKGFIPPLGLLTLAALLPRQWDIRLRDLNVAPLSEDDWQWAQVLMISGMCVHSQGMRKIIGQARQRSIPVAAGGPGPSGLSEVYLEAGADVVFAGEAESGLDRVLEALTRGDSGRLIRAESKPDLSLSPIPRFDLLNLKDYFCMPVQTARGCPHDCEFCDIVNLFGRRVRHKSSEQTLAELDALHSLGWLGEVFLCDDNFIGHREHARDLLTELDRWSTRHHNSFHFITQASIDLGADPELIDLMTQAMVDWVFVGVESSDTEVLQRAGKKQNLDNAPVEMINNMKKGGITVIASFMIGCDGEEPGVDRRIMDMVNATSTPLVMINQCQAIPGTRLWQRLAQEGRLVEDRDWFEQQGFSHRMVPQRDSQEIDDEIRALWRDIYKPTNFLKRSFNYHMEMRPTRAAQARAKGLQPEADVLGGKKQGHDAMGELLKVWWLLRRQGILVGPRRAAQFWRQLWTMKQKNPSRIVRYLNVCGMGEDLMKIRREMLAERK